jgi:hypothetical protein
MTKAATRFQGERYRLFFNRHLTELELNWNCERNLRWFLRGLGGNGFEFFVREYDGVLLRYRDKSVGEFIKE